MLEFSETEINSSSLLLFTQLFVFTTVLVLACGDFTDWLSIEEPPDNSSEMCLFWATVNNCPSHMNAKNFHIYDSSLSLFGGD